MVKFNESDINPVNTNEIQTDYHFYLQLLLEENCLDFECEL
ncbi:MAG TPA: hypothetical protein VJ951_06040 [Bacteroidales bacterium]|nr:hypothetical protein [Bacteroidales bacterium]